MSQIFLLEMREAEHLLWLETRHHAINFYSNSLNFWKVRDTKYHNSIDIPKIQTDYLKGTPTQPFFKVSRFQRQFHATLSPNASIGVSAWHPKERLQTMKVIDSKARTRWTNTPKNRIDRNTVMDRDCKSWRVILRTYSEDNPISVSDTINFNREVNGLSMPTISRKWSRTRCLLSKDISLYLYRVAIFPQISNQVL